MPTNTNADPTFIPLRYAAEALGLPMTWLESEARANRIPCIRANRRMLFDPASVRQVLVERSEKRASDSSPLCEDRPT